MTRFSNLLIWNNRTVGATTSTPFWMNLVRTFGTELLYFLIDKEYADQIPESTAALKLKISQTLNKSAK